MTTNHKPTFESRRARDPYANGGSSIQHGGATHRKLKYRKTSKNEDFSEHRKKLDELDKELEQREKNGNISKYTKTITDSIKPVELNYDEELESESRIELKDENEVKSDIKVQEDEDNDNEDESDDSDSDSDSDDELLKELQKLKEQKQESVKETAKIEPNTSKPLKKSWRQSTLRNKPLQSPSIDQNLNNTLKSRSHQQFMDRHVK